MAHCGPGDATQMDNWEMKQQLTVVVQVQQLVQTVVIGVQPVVVMLIVLL
jgi:hypothetical protein